MKKQQKDKKVKKDRREKLRYIREVSAEQRDVYKRQVRKTPNSNGQYGVGVTDGGDFTMTGGKIEAGWFAVAGNGNYKTHPKIFLK